MYISTGVKLVVGLIGLFVIMRILGKKTLSEVTPFDLIYTLVLGGIVEGALYDDAVHIGHMLFALAIWGMLIYIIEVFVQKADKPNRIIKGKPSILIRDGKLNIVEIEKNHIEMEQLRTLLRSQNCFSLKEAQHAILETGGEISVMRKADAKSELSILLIDEGRIEKDALENIGKDEQWLLEELAKETSEKAEDVIYAEWTEEQGLYAIPYSATVQDKSLIDD